METNNHPPLVIVPAAQLSEIALRGLIEEFIQREATDYGQTEITFDEKYERVINQVTSNNVVIVFNVDDETTSLMRKDQLPRVKL